MNGKRFKCNRSFLLGALAWKDFDGITPTQSHYTCQSEKTNYHFGRCCKYLYSQNSIFSYACAIFSISSGAIGGYTVSNFMFSNELSNENIETILACSLGNVIALGMVGVGIIAIANIFREAINKGKSNGGNPLLVLYDIFLKFINVFEYSWN